MVMSEGHCDPAYNADMTTLHTLLNTLAEHTYVQGIPTVRPTRTND
jgi:hypothetical protein